jgi:hypothetical protein
MTKQFQVSTIVRANRCKHCAANGVDPALLGVVVFDLQSSCSYCGHVLHNATGDLPEALTSVIRSLVGHGTYHIDLENTDHNVVRLFTIDQDGTLITLDMFHMCFGRGQEKPHRRFDRSQVACPLPDAVLSGVEALTRLNIWSVGPGEPHTVAVSFESADVREARKLLRFSAEVWKDAVPGLELLRFEFAWTPAPKSNSAIPTPEELSGKKPTRLAEMTAKELQIKADTAELTAEAVSALRREKGQCTVYLLRKNVPTYYDIAAINKVIEDLYDSGWECGVPAWLEGVTDRVASRYGDGSCMGIRPRSQSGSETKTDASAS